MKIFSKIKLGDVFLFCFSTYTACLFAFLFITSFKVARLSIGELDVRIVAVKQGSCEK